VKHLYQPIHLGPLTIPNRVALAPMDLGFKTVDETWSERFIRYIEERCRGEVGLIITHFTRATLLASSPIIGSYDDRFIDSHRRLAEVVHRYDSKIFLQIAAQGGKGGGAAPSAIASPNYPETPRELTIEEIEHIIQDFARAAARARVAGYDGVELHGAHTYLVGAFVSPHTNRRTDRFGGGFEGRMRFPVEILHAIRREAGEDFPVGYKFSAWEELPGGVDPELAVRIAGRMAQEGVCYLHVASTSSTLGRYSKYPSVPTLYIPRNVLLPFARKVKQSTPDAPVIAAGAISDPREAEEMIARGDCDMVAIGRALMADPHWARKARQGRRVRPCIRCNVCYQQLRERDAVLICTVNPYLTLETQAPLLPATYTKNVLVVGGGPGGIVAALTAAERGHQVTLYEKGNALGGELIPGSQPAFKAEIGRLLEYWREEVADASIQIRLNAEVTPETVRGVRPDALIVAVGGTLRMPDIPGIDGSNVMNAVQAFLHPDPMREKTIAVLGGGDVGCECALFLAEFGCRVTIVESLDELLQTEEVLSIRVDLLKMLEEAEIKAVTGAEPVAIHEEGVLVRLRDDKQLSLPADFVIVAIGMEPLSTLAHQLAAECDDVRIVGDCVQPRRIRDAVVEGELAGRLV
jgi:2,4-dienoyl-CoA reductase-like NADH-dependent reductase (Old Yellow Enzyme family)/thioredoxin reductase